ncbi:MAG: hypothetical protein U0X75_17625 [Acidobacteriota bacterium]
MFALQHVDPGFSPANVLTARIGLPPTTYATREPVAAFYRQLRERLALYRACNPCRLGLRFR